MRCREAEKLIVAERDGALGESQRAALDAHLGFCASCRSLRANFIAAAQTWKAMDAKVAVPSVEREWQAIRRRMRAAERPRSTARPAWMVPSIAAVAAMAAAAFFVGNPWDGREETGRVDVARAEYVEVADESASTLVYVDEESGWLVVWAVSPPEEAGS